MSSVKTEMTCGHLFAGTCYITDCVLGELEKMGPKYRLGLRAAKDPRFKRLPCLHKGTYADDCIIERVTQVSMAHTSAV